MQKLTVFQEEVYNFLVDNSEDNVFLLKIKDIANKFDCAQMSAITILNTLDKKGFIKKEILSPRERRHGAKVVIL